MMDILKDQGLWDYVTETAPTDPDLLNAWNKKDRTALSTIRLCIADKLLVYVASAKTAKAAWEALENLLETQGALGIVLARQKLFQAQCEEGTSIEVDCRHLRFLFHDSSVLWFHCCTAF